MLNHSNNSIRKTVILKSFISSLNQDKASFLGWGCGDDWHLWPDEELLTAVLVSFLLEV